MCNKKNKNQFFHRFVGVLLPAIPIALYKQEEVFPYGKRILLLMLCFVGSTAALLSVYAFRYTPLADASVILFTTPVFVAIFARLFLREPFGPFNVITVLLTLVGVVLIARPPGSNSSGLLDASVDNVEDDVYTHGLWGPVAAFSSTLFGANAYVLMRALKGLNVSVIMTNVGAFALVYTVLAAWLLGAICWPPHCTDRLAILALAIFGGLGQALLTISLKLERAGPVAIARSADIVFAFMWQVMFFKTVPNVYSIVGALLVIAAVGLTGIRAWTMSMSRECTVRKRLRFIFMD